MLEPRQTGEALLASAGALARIWRSARLEARPDLFPGTLDDLIEPFFAATGEALATGRDPEHVWGPLAGVVRVDVRGGAEETWLAEWRLAAEVLHAACDALGASPEATDLVARATERARRGTEELLAGARPRGFLLVWTLGGFRPRGG